MDVTGKAFAVTGAAGGMGQAIVRRLAEAGARVAGLDIATDRIDADLCRPIACDVTDQASVDEAAEAVKAWCDGPLAGLVNAAGIVSDEPLVSIGPGGLKLHEVATWQRTIEVNLTGVFRMARGLIPLLAGKRKGGVIVNISSVSRRGNAGQGAYAASKAGIDAMTRSWALELGFFQVRAVAIAPGITETPLIQDMPEGLLADYKKRMPLRRLAKPADIADCVLAVIANDYINGTTVEVDGGFSY